MYNVTTEIADTKIKIMKTVCFSDVLLDEHITLFTSFQSKNFIDQKCRFEDNKWILHNEVFSRSVNFQIDEIKLKCQINKRNLNFDHNQLMQGLKHFTLLLLNNYYFITVYIILLSIKWFLHETHFFDLDEIKNFKIKNRKGNNIHLLNFPFFIDFIDYFELIEIPDDYYDFVEAIIEEHSQRNNQRSLSTYETMFKFDDIINDFIATANSKDKETYFPIILWWKITSQIPLRVTEFTIIPYECTKIINGKYKLILMRANSKGRKANATYDQSTDGRYTAHEIEINKEIYDLICEYKTIVDKYDLIYDFYGENTVQIGIRPFLLSRRSNIICTPRSWKALTSFIKDVFMRKNLEKLLQRFFIEICNGKRYNLDIIEKLMITEINGEKKPNGNLIQELSPYQLEKIRLMDTRHFAIINMLLSDLPLVVIKNLAGHSDIGSTFHYYSHLDVFVHNYTYHLAKKRSINNIDWQTFNSTIKQTPDAKVTYFLPKIRSGEVHGKPLDNGWCIYEENDCTPCKKYNYSCTGGCVYYVPDCINTEGIKENLTHNKDTIESAIKVIIDIIKDRKIIKNYESRIKSEVNKIRSCVEQNSEILAEHVLRNN